MISRNGGPSRRGARFAREGGFTLLETLVVLAIFGILAVVAVYEAIEVILQFR